MKPLFDIAFVTANFDTINIGHYLCLLKSASKSELKSFKKQVIAHGKQNKERLAFLDIPNYSSHRAVVSAIEYELLKRSWKYELFKIIFPIRKWLVKMFSGIDLKEHEYLGTLYCPKNSRSGMWHLSHHELMKIIIVFWLHRWPILLPVIIGAAVALFIHFDSNTNSTGQAEQKENHQVASVNHGDSRKP